MGMSAQVRVWNVESGKCLVCFNFGRPIASLAFHAAGCFLAVASGHKVGLCHQRECSCCRGTQCMGGDGIGFHGCQCCFCVFFIVFQSADREFQPLSQCSSAIQAIETQGLYFAQSSIENSHCFMHMASGFCVETDGPSRLVRRLSRLRCEHERGVLSGLRARRCTCGSTARRV